VPRAASRAALGIGANDRWSPCCRAAGAEIQYIAPRLLAPRPRAAPPRPELRFLIPVVPGLRTLIEPLRRHHAPDVQIELLEGRSHEALAACDVALVASGTRTLEAALFKRPMVVVYAMHALSWQMSKRMKLPAVGALPNILLRDFPCRKCCRATLSAAKIAAAAPRLDRTIRAPVPSLRAASSKLHEELRCDTAQLATDAIEKGLAGLCSTTCCSTSPAG
jgi:lipid-A-disaccharide synthase